MNNIIGIVNTTMVRQIKAFRARFAQSVESMLGEVISPKRLEEYIKAEVETWRNRTFTPILTLLMFLEQTLSADKSCNEAVSKERDAQASRGEKSCSSNNSSYCTARKRLPLALISRLGKEVGAELVAKQPKAWLWRGRQIKLVDGATVTMPDTPENQAVFPQNSQQKQGLGFPMARIVAIVSLSCGAVLEWATDACVGKQTGETALLWKLSEKFKPGDVVIADRYYSGYFMIAWLIQYGVDIVFRQHSSRKTDFRRGQRLGKKDHIAHWSRPRRPLWMSQDVYESMPETLTIREVQVGGWIIVSTLIDAREVSKVELNNLYRLRWYVELDILSIKAVMQMDVLRCKSPEMIHKEIAAHFAAYNLVRTVMAQAADQHHLSPRGLSFKGALQELRAFGKSLSDCFSELFISLCSALLDGIAHRKLPYRPGRVEPRAVKRRPKPRALLTKPRKVEQERLRKMAHEYATG